MKCHLFTILLQRYHDGDLDPGERAEYERHRMQCADCRALDRQFSAVFEALGGIPLLEPAGDFNARVMARVDVSRYRRRRARYVYRALENAWWWVPKPIRIALPVCVIFSMFASIYTPVLEFLIVTGQRVLAFAGSSLLVIKELAARSDLVFEFLSSAANYKVAGEVLARSMHRIVSEVPVVYVGLTAAALLFVLFVVIRAARIAWKKGDMNVSIF